MRHTTNGVGGGAGMGCAALILALMLGAMVITAITRADLFKTQPSAAVVSVAYSNQSRVLTAATEKRLAAELAHDQKAMAIDLEFKQTLKDVGIIGIAALIICAVTWAGSKSLHEFGLINTMRPNSRGQFAIRMDKRRGLAYNPNLQTTAAFLFDDPAANVFDPELQLETFRIAGQSNIAASMSHQKVMPMTAMQERRMIGQALQSSPDRGQPVPPPIVIGGTDDAGEIEGFITDAGKTQPINQNTNPNTRGNTHELTESEYNNLNRSGV